MNSYNSLANNTMGISCDELDLKMSQIMDCLMEDISPDTRQALLSSAVDLFTLQFDQGSTSSGSSCSTQAHVDIPQPDLDISPAQKPVSSIYSLHETSGTEFQLPSTSFLQETSSTELQPPSTICPQETNSTEFQFPCNFSLEEACCTEFQFPNPCTLFEDLIPFEAAERQQTTVEPATPSRKRKLENEEENRLGDNTRDTKRARSDVNNNNCDVNQAAQLFDICPKTGYIYIRQNPIILSDKERRGRFKKRSSLLVKATRKCMLLKASRTKTYCCFRKCYLRKPRL